MHGSLVEDREEAAAIDDVFLPDGSVIPGAFPIQYISDTYYPDSNVTCITATTPGITQYSYNKIMAKEISDYVKSQIQENGDINLENLQEFLRERKIKDDSNRDLALHYKKFGEKYRMYERDVGWRISKNKWLNKNYSTDFNQMGDIGLMVLKLDETRYKGPPIIGLLADMLTQQGKHTMHTKHKRKRITKQQLIEYLLKLGLKNILLIDSSCGDQFSLKSEREIRKLKFNSIFQGVAGGKRKTKSKSKTKRNIKRKTKRR
jgi:hypothetical protein